MLVYLFERVNVVSVKMRKNILIVVCIGLVYKLFSICSSYIVGKILEVMWLVLLLLFCINFYYKCGSLGIWIFKLVWMMF